MPESIIYMVVASVVTAALGWLGLKKGGRVGAAFHALRETAQLIFAVTDAVEDDKITTEETKRIAKEAKEAALAYKKVFGGPV